jgi:hypothetical protein
MRKKAYFLLPVLASVAVLGLAMSGQGLVLAQEPGLRVDRDRAPALSNGMRYYQVLKLWGAPLEKKTEETHRQEVWIYHGGKVIFQGGQVVAWIAPSELDEKAGSGGASASPGPDESEKADQRRRNMAQVLGEIIQDLPENKADPEKD